MLDPQETAELRSLQRQAYGPEGALDAAGSARLRALEQRVRGIPVVNAQPSSAEEENVGATADDPHEETGRSAGADPAGAPGTGEPATAAADGADDGSSGPSARGWFHRAGRVPLVLGTAVLALVVGAGVSWWFFGPRSVEPQISAELQQYRGQLEASGSYDAGSVTPLGEEHGVAGWRATKEQGDDICLVLTPAGVDLDGASVTCLSDEQFGEQGTPNMTIVATATIPDGEESAGDIVSFVMVRSITGELATVAQVQMSGSTDYDWRDQYSGTELEQAEAIVAAGYEGDYLNIIGYDDDVAVWSSWNPEGGGYCLAGVGDDVLQPGEGCPDAGEQQVSLNMATVATDTGKADATTYTIAWSDNRSPTLTIERASTTFGAVVPDAQSTNDPSTDTSTLPDE